MRIIVIRVGDVKLYPPTISLMNIICNLGYECIFISTGDSFGVERAVNNGVKIDYIDYNYDESKSIIGKAFDRSKIERMLWEKIKSYYDSDSLLWIMSDVTIKHLGYRLLNYRYILHMDELNDGIYYTAKFKQFKLDANKLGNSAKAVVVPEYNRAHITKAWWGLDKLPYILPNKPYVNENEGIIDKISKQAQSILDKLEEKKIILYQGGLGKERPIYKFVEAVEELENYAFVIMSSNYSEYLDKGYKNCYFINYMTPPMHLNVTAKAYIGIVTYVATLGQNSVLNALYCAPNKIFEYAKYGVPIIGNDIPGLRSVVNEYRNGIIVEKMNKEEIKKAIKRIEVDYDRYSRGAYMMYEKTDNKGIVAEIIKSSVR